MLSEVFNFIMGRLPFQEQIDKAAYIVRRCALFPRALRLKEAHVSGLAADGGGPFEFVYLGEGWCLPWLRQTLLREARQEKAAAFPLWRLNQRMRASADKTVIVELDRLFQAMLARRGMLSYGWVRQKALLSQWSSAKVNHYYRSLMRKYQHTYTITHDRAAVEEFYDCLYLPYTSERFKQDCFIISKPRLLREARRGFLLQIHEGGQWVSGNICRVVGKRVSGECLGLRPDFAVNRARGSLVAIYYYLFEWARENGMEEVILGGSRPRADDGVYQHKHRWGVIDEPDDWPKTALCFVLPEGRPLPSILRKQLVLHGDKFASMETAIAGKSAPASGPAGAGVE